MAGVVGDDEEQRVIDRIRAECISGSNGRRCDVYQSKMDC